MGLHAKMAGGELLADVLGLNGGEAIFIDELHSLGGDTAEYFQLAMEGVDPAHGTPMMPWTLVAATTKLGDVPQPIRDRFGLLLHLGFYPQADMEKIALKAAGKLNMTLRPKSATEIADRARGTPRIGNRLLKRVRDVTDEPTPKQVAATLLELGIDSWGLESCDRSLLLLIYKRFNGGPVGLRTLAAAYGLDEKTLAEAYEPYLIGHAGLLNVTERGRQLTTKGFLYCKKVAVRLEGI